MKVKQTSLPAASTFLEGLQETMVSQLHPTLLGALLGLLEFP